MSSTRSRQIVLEASPVVQPNPEPTMQGDASHSSGDEHCEALRGDDCEPADPPFDWDTVNAW